MVEEPPKPPERRPRIVLTIFAIAVVSLAGIAAYAFTRPKSIGEVLSQDHWSPGSVALEGRIASVSPVNTTYGSAIILGLDGDPLCRGVALTMSVFGDPTETYRVGDSFRTTLHFREFRINGVRAVWAPELACPFPALTTTIGTVMDAVSLVAGFSLENRGIDSQGWTTFQILTRNGDTYPLSAGSMALLRSPVGPGFDVIDGVPAWMAFMETEYGAMISGYGIGVEIDSMTSFGQGTSAGGRLRFVDADGDLLAGDHDRILVRLDPEAGEDYQMYFLTIGGFMRANQGLVLAGKSILNGPRGPFEIFPPDDSGQFLQLTDMGEVPGPTANSTIGIGRTVGRAGAWPEYSFLLQIEDGPIYQGSMRTGTQTLGPGLTMSGADVEGDGRLSTGDAIDLRGLPNATGVHLQLVRIGGPLVGSLAWYPGYGHVSGALPTVSFTARGSNPYSFVADMAFPHPEFAFGKTLRVSLHEEGQPVLDHVPLTAGSLGSWPNGTLAFYDRDLDGTWSSGDEFLVQAFVPRAYHLEVSLLFDSRRYPGDVGP